MPQQACGIQPTNRQHTPAAHRQHTGSSLTLLVHQLAALLPLLVANAAAQVVAVDGWLALPLPPADGAWEARRRAAAWRRLMQGGGIAERVARSSRHG